MSRRLSRKSTEPTEIASGPRGAGALVAAQGLDPRQAKAMEAIILGRSVQEAADAAGVDRATLYRWRVSDPQFMRALAQWRQEVTASAYERLSGLSGAATAAVQLAIEAGDGRLGFRLLHSMRATQPPAPPPEMSDGRAVAFKRWMMRVINPGARPEAVEAFVKERFGLSDRDAGNTAYRQYEIRCPMRRPVADAILKELNELGAYAGMQEIDVVLMEEDLPDGFSPGPTERFPPDVSTPGFFDCPRDHPGLDAYFAKLKKRREELKAMDAAEEQEQEKRRAESLAKQLDKGSETAQKTP